MYSEDYHIQAISSQFKWIAFATIFDAFVVITNFPLYFPIGIDLGDLIVLTFLRKSLVLIQAVAIFKGIFAYFYWHLHTINSTTLLRFYKLGLYIYILDTAALFVLLFRNYSYDYLLDLAFHFFILYKLWVINPENVNIK